MSNHSDLSFIGIATGTAANSVSTAVLAAPSGVSAGMLLVCAFTLAGQGSSGVQPTISTPSGWTLVPSAQSNPFVNQTTNAGSVMALYYRWATGSDTMPSWNFASGSTFFKWAGQVACYSPLRLSGDSYSEPFAIFTATRSGSSGNTFTSPSGSIAGTKTPALVFYGCRSTTNASYSTPSGLTKRGSGVFGSGGAASDLGWYDYGSELNGPLAAKTVTSGTNSPWGNSALMILPQRNFDGPGIPMF